MLAKFFSKWWFEFAIAGALLTVVVGVLWNAHHAGAKSQAAKDAPVILEAKTAAAVSQGSADVATSQVTNTNQRVAREAAITERTNAHVKAVQDAGGDSDAAFRAYLAGLHDSAATDGLGGSSLPGGPGAQGASDKAR